MGLGMVPMSTRKLPEALPRLGSFARELVVLTFLGRSTHETDDQHAVSG